MFLSQQGYVQMSWGCKNCFGMDSHCTGRTLADCCRGKRPDVISPLLIDMIYSNHRHRDDLALLEARRLWSWSVVTSAHRKYSPCHTWISCLVCFPT